MNFCPGKPSAESYTLRRRHSHARSSKKFIGTTAVRACWRIPHSFFLTSSTGGRSCSASTTGLTKKLSLAHRRHASPSCGGSRQSWCPRRALTCVWSPLRTHILLTFGSSLELGAVYKCVNPVDLEKSIAAELAISNEEGMRGS